MAPVLRHGTAVAGDVVVGERAAISSPSMSTRLRFSSLLLVLVVPLTIASCSDDGGGGGAESDVVADLPPVPDGDYVDMTGESEVVIDAKDNVFDAQFVLVSPGTKVTFENEGRNPHNVIPVVEDQFDSIPADDLQPGDVRSITVDGAGEYPYYCSLHGTPKAGMDGRIRVADE
jgi:plastocyanin